MSQAQELYLIMQRKKTNHILHLLLALITAGFWVPIWLLVALSNANENMKIEKKLKQLNQ